MCGTIEIIWSIILLFAGASIAHLYSLHLLKKQDFYKAVTNFKISFAPILEMIDRDSANYNFTIVERTILSQDKVYYDLMPLIDERKMRGFQIAWEEYTCKNNKNDKPLLQYWTSDPEKEKEIKKNLNQRIRNLMVFTK